jgi:hypothetical protein
LAPLAACAPPLSLNATFLQLWRSHLDLSPDDWRVRLSAYRRLGCREIFLQWVGLEGGRPDDWMVPDAVLRLIFDEAERQGLGVHVGLPYDQRWWDVLASQDKAPSPATWIRRARAAWPIWSRRRGPSAARSEAGTCRMNSSNTTGHRPSARGS